MADASSPVALDLAGQVSRVLRSNGQTQKFIAERKTLMAEAAKPERDRTPAPWQVGVTGMASWRQAPRPSARAPPSSS